VTSLVDSLRPLSDRHRQALRWFVERTGTDVSWPQPLELPEGATLLAAKAKGIYKPEWTKYALSVRQSLGGPYPDRDPVVRPDGSWLYSYFQENADPSARDTEYTNRALIACMEDEVPVAVIRQIRGKPNSTYHVLGLALVTGWDAGYFFFEGFSNAGTAAGVGPQGEIALLEAIAEGESAKDGSFDPKSVIDGRERTVAQITRRRGQPAFRRALLTAYRSRCAITGCDAEEALEAAHIAPYRGVETNCVPNGLLLRADIHTLFDLGLIAISPTTLTILVADSLRNTIYADLEGKPMWRPAGAADNPSAAALEFHLEWCGLRS
jgi:putative restriction endonuclease